MKISKRITFLILSICIAAGIFAGFLIPNMPNDSPLLAKLAPIFCLLFVAICAVAATRRKGERRK